MILPQFTINGYKELIHSITRSGFQVKPISALPDKHENCVYLRHDVDLSISLVVNVAELESAAGISATYFVLLTGTYNPFHEESIAAIRKIRSLGHEIGLHYDLKNWPENRKEADEKLKNEIAILESISESKVDAIVMHEPFRGGVDFFATDVTESGLINPTYYQKTDGELCYVSDSCRAWRDDTIIKFIERKLPQTRLMLNTHPELWLATKSQSRIAYLENELTPAVTKSIRDYFRNTVKPAWETHHAAVTGYGDQDEE
jgi:hypothetical protein